MKNIIIPNKAIVFTIFIICAAILSIAAYRHPFSYDGFWHLKMGEDFLLHGLSPYIDHLSFTYNGEPVSRPPVIFQITLASLVQLFGVIPGYQLIKLLTYTALLICIYFYFRKINANWLVVLCILPAIVFFIELRAIVRPELFSYPLMVIALILYHRARESFTGRELLYLAVLLVIWGNYHNPVFGYIISFGLFFEKGLEKIFWKNKDYSWRFLLGWGAVVFLSGFVNPEGSHFIFKQLEFSPEWYNLISEYGDPGKLFRDVHLVYALWVISFITVILLVYNKQYGLAFICLVVSINAWKYARIVTPAALIVLLSLSSSLSTEKSISSIKKLRHSFKKIGVITIVLFSITSFSSAIVYAANIIKKNHLSSTLYPSDIIEYLSEADTGGNILNQYNIGGYLAYYLAPKYKVYIDGRTDILYPADFMQRYMSFFRSNGMSELKADIEKYDIDYAVVKINRENLYYFEKTGIFRTDIVGRNFILFSRLNPQFPESGRIMMLPMCWNKNIQQRINTEISRKNILPSQSALLPVLEFLEAYNSSDDKQQFIDDYSKKDNTSDYAQRLAAYVALQEGYHQQSADLFYKIRNKESMDFFLMASELMNAGKYEEIEKILHFAIYGKWSKDKTVLGAIDKAIIYTLLDETKNKHGLKVFDEDVMKVLKKEVNGEFPLPLPKIYPDSVCL